MSDQQTVTFNGKPYYIVEGETGIFNVLKSATLTDLSNQQWTQENDQNIGHLVLGKDIQEIPTRGLTLLLRIPSGHFRAPYFVAECRKLAKITWYEYVTLDNFGPYVAHFVKMEGDIGVHEIKPRLFKKIVND